MVRTSRRRIGVSFALIGLGCAMLGGLVYLDFFGGELPLPLYALILAILFLSTGSLFCAGIANLFRQNENTERLSRRRILASAGLMALGCLVFASFICIGHTWTAYHPGKQQPPLLLGLTYVALFIGSSILFGIGLFNVFRRPRWGVLLGLVTPFLTSVLMGLVMDGIVFPIKWQMTLREIRAERQQKAGAEHGSSRQIDRIDHADDH
jgi:hypothetical protein